MKGLTERQREVLQVMIDHLLDRHTHAPIRFIAAAVGISSTNCVAEHVRALERKGYVERVDGDGFATPRVLRWPDGAPFKLRTRREPTPPWCEGCGDQDDGCEECNGAA
ncbi:MAG: hypothetical protein KC583_06785 [Myxococcales bacterium]|nr:hypothetical protein [Myxococcales bacterium]